MLFAVPALYFWLWAGREKGYGGIFPKVEPYYRMAHSVFTPIILFAGLWMLFRRLYWPVLAGYLLHLLLDLPLHKGGWVQDIAPFYPFYNRKVKGRWWWKEVVEKYPWIVVVNYSLAALVYFVA